MRFSDAGGAGARRRRLCLLLFVSGFFFSSLLLLFNHLDFLLSDSGAWFRWVCPKWTELFRRDLSTPVMVSSLSSTSSSSLLARLPKSTESDLGSGKSRRISSRLPVTQSSMVKSFMGKRLRAGEDLSLVVESSSPVPYHLVLEATLSKETLFLSTLAAFMLRSVEHTSTILLFDSQMPKPVKENTTEPSIWTLPWPLQPDLGLHFVNLFYASMGLVTKRIASTHWLNALQGYRPSSLASVIFFILNWAYKILCSPKSAYVPLVETRGRFQQLNSHWEVSWLSSRVSPKDHSNHSCTELQAIHLVILLAGNEICFLNLTGYDLCWYNLLSMQNQLDKYIRYNVLSLLILATDEGYADYVLFVFDSNGCVYVELDWEAKIGMPSLVFNFELPLSFTVVSSSLVAYQRPIPVLFVSPLDDSLKELSSQISSFRDKERLSPSASSLEERNCPFSLSLRVRLYLESFLSRISVFLTLLQSCVMTYPKSEDASTITSGLIAGMDRLSKSQCKVTCAKLVEETTGIEFTKCLTALSCFISLLTFYQTMLILSIYCFLDLNFLLNFMIAHLDMSNVAFPFVIV